MIQRLAHIKTAALQSTLLALSRQLMALFIFLTLSTPSWRSGPFSWLPLVRVEELAGAPVAIGPLNLLPALVLGTWLAGRILTRARQLGIAKSWRWGRLGITLPLLGITILGLSTLHPLSPRRTFIQAGNLFLVWFIYLFILNEGPRFWLALGLAAVLQSAVAIGQFVAQSDLGLTFMGELLLNPAWLGVSVVWSRETRWLRGHGLTAHPNLLGAILAAILLFALPGFRRKRYRIPFALFYTITVVGLLVSFSRAAILGYLLGLASWLWLQRPTLPEISWKWIRGWLFRIEVVLPTLAATITFLLIGDLYLSRVVALDTPTEARSINERLSDTAVAMEMIADHPWRGVGLGAYTDFAGQYEEHALRVHNVLLLMAAELGLPALALSLWMMISGLRAPPDAVAPWLAMILVGLFDTTLWFTSIWQMAVVFGIMAAGVGQGQLKTARDEEL